MRRRGAVDSAAMHVDRLLPIGLAAALVAVDQASKAWIVANVPLGVREYTLGLGFHVTHTRNSGAAFGMLRDLQWPIGPVLIDATVVLGLLNLVVSVAIVGYLLARGEQLDRLTRAALSLVLAGAAGNMIDRLRLGYVVDFIDFQVGGFDFAVFNVADASIVVGAGLLVLSGLLDGRARGGLAAHRRADERPTLERRTATAADETLSADEADEAATTGQVGR
jgi:signal peptidase II